MRTLRIVPLRVERATHIFLLLVALLPVSRAVRGAAVSCSGPLLFDEVYPYAFVGAMGETEHPRIELFNIDTVGVAFAGWRLVDRAGTTRAVLPATTLPGRAFLVVHCCHL